MLFGGIVTWVLLRYPFPGKRIIDELVDLPFALPTVVAGIALTALDSRNGWLGRYLEPLSIKVACTPLDVLVALTFVDLPFALIRQYVALGVGVGIVVTMVVGQNCANGLVAIEVSHLFAPNVTRLAVRRGAYLRSYMIDFILQFAPRLERASIESAIKPGL